MIIMWSFLCCLIVSSAMISVVLPIWQYIEIMNIKDWFILIILDNALAVCLFAWWFAP